MKSVALVEKTQSQAQVMQKGLQLNVGGKM